MLRVIADQYNREPRRGHLSKILDSTRFKTLNPGPETAFNDAPDKNFFLRLLKKEHLEKAQQFYEKHGGKTIIMARFVPIVRTFAPFVAGVGSMNYSRFISYNVIGGIIWVTALVLAGYYLAGFDFVREHFEHIVLGIIGISVAPIVIEYFRSKKQS